VNENISRSFTFQFEDSKWILKILLGGILMFIPILNFLSIGFAMRILRNTSQGSEPFLPEFDNWEELFKEGLFGFIITMIYSIGFFIIFSVLGILTGIPLLGCLFGLVNLALMFVLGFFSIVWFNLSLIKYMETNDLKSAFDVVAIYNEFKSKAKDYLIAAVVYSLAISILTLFCCFPAFYGVLASAAGIGAIYYSGKSAETVSDESSEEEPEFE